MSNKYKPIGGHRGRQKKTVAQKLADGNPGHLPINMAVCNLPKVENAECPKDWPDSAQRSFARLKTSVTTGAELNVRTEPAFRTLCLLDGLVDDAAQFARLCQKKGEGWMIAKYGAGIGVSPAVRLIWQAAQNAKPYYDAFGMTAASVQDIVSEAISAAEEFRKL